MIKHLLQLLEREQLALAIYSNKYLNHLALSISIFIFLIDSNRNALKLLKNRSLNDVLQLFCRHMRLLNPIMSIGKSMKQL